MFSKTFGYALRAAVYITLHGGNHRKIGLQELSHHLEIPHHFLGKIMQDLVRHGILDSSKGPSGGFYHNARTQETFLIDILKLTDGPSVFNSCALGIRQCNAQRPCPLHHEFALMRAGMLRALEEKTLRDLAQSTRDGNTFLSTLIQP